VKIMKKVELTVTKTKDCGFMANSPESFGFFAIGDTRDEAIANAREGLSMTLEIEEKDIEFEITDVDETK
jgi:predicted RNase H-like HicB family nuclease